MNNSGFNPYFLKSQFPLSLTNSHQNEQNCKTETATGHKKTSKEDT